MSDTNQSSQPTQNNAQNEGGLRAPPGLSPLRKLWWWFDFIVLVNLARLRFIFILVAIGLVIVYWDTLAAYYDKWTRTAKEEQHTASSDVEYFCPMHPTVIRDNPKDKCPICFMPLSKRKKGEATLDALPPGIVSRVQLSPYRVVLAGIHTWTVDYVPLTKKITAVGYVEFNERELKQVSARVKGRIDKLFINQTGEMVHVGDVLASIYSPDLMVTAQNLLDAKRNNNADLLRIARDRLQLWDISDVQIDEILQTNKANSHLNIRSPIEGHVLKKYVKEGQYVEEGMLLYDVADLSTVWIQAQVYEDDLVFLPPQEQFHKQPVNRKDGLPITAMTRAFPNEKFLGTLTFVYPHVDVDTRTVTVRFELDNPGHKLRPGSSATVELDVPPSQLALLSKTATDEQRAKLLKGVVLAVPESAVIDTGSQQIVYREAAHAQYEGVKVELGPRMVGPEGVSFFPIFRGLQQGDKIVTAGSFLVDAETRLNPAAGSIYFGGTGSNSAKVPSGSSTVKPSTPDDEEATIKANLAKLPTEADQRAALSQEFCPILDDSKLGSMGVPLKLMLDGQPVFVCCKGCIKDAQAKPKETLAKVEKLKQAKKDSPVKQP